MNVLNIIRNSEKKKKSLYKAQLAHTQKSTCPVK